MTRHMLAGMAAAVVVALAADAVEALPRFAASEGGHCGRCHVNPTGGGARTRYGHNVYAAHELTMELIDREPVLNAEFPIGRAVTVGVGSDLRVAYHWEHAPQTLEADRSTFFPMQTDLYVHAEVGPYVTAYLDRGFNRFEVFGMVHDRQKDVWTKAGQFVLPYGLRLANHSAYVRSETGFDPRGTYYGLDAGLEGGARLGPIRVIAAVANGRSPARGGTRLFDENTRKAIVGSVEWARDRSGLRFRAGVSGYHNFVGRRTVDVGDDEVELQADDRLKIDQIAAYGTISTGRWTLVNEADLFRRRDFETDPETFEETIGTTTGLATYHQVTLRALQGVHPKVSWEYLDRQLGEADGAIHRVGAGAELFPMTGWEWQVLYRHSFEEGNDGNEVFTQVHFYF